MSWHYKSPKMFPAMYGRALKAACLESGANHIMYADRDHASVADAAEKFRWFKWCIRKDPGVVPDLAKILEEHEVRTQIKSDGIGFILYVTCKPTKISEFVRLNPELARSL